MGISVTNINVGSVANDGTGDSLRTAGQTINTNFSNIQTNAAPKDNVLLLDNTTPFVPSDDYEPATKKYVDDNVVSDGAVHGGFYSSWDWLTGSGTPTSGKFTTSSSTPNATTFKIHKTTKSGAIFNGLITSMEYIVVKEKSTGNESFHKITSIVDNTTYYTLTVSGLFSAASIASFVNGTEYSIAFASKSGDVSGAASSGNNDIALFDGTTGKAIKTSGYSEGDMDDWSTFHNTPSTRITAGTNLSWSGNTLNALDGYSYWTAIGDDLTSKQIYDLTNVKFDGNDGIYTSVTNSGSDIIVGLYISDNGINEDKLKSLGVGSSGNVLTSDGSGGFDWVNLSSGTIGAGTYGSTSDNTKIDTITVDSQGKITAITTGVTGDIFGVTAGTGLSGGGTSGTVTLDLADTAVTAGTYTNANITVDAQGRLTSASNGDAGISTAYGFVYAYNTGGTPSAGGWAHDGALNSISAATTVRISWTENETLKEIEEYLTGSYSSMKLINKSDGKWHFLTISATSSGSNYHNFTVSYIDGTDNAVISASNEYIIIFFA